MVLVANDEPAEVLKPGEEALDFPATSVAIQPLGILGRVPATPVRGDHLDAVVLEHEIEFVAVVRLVPDQMLGEISDEVSSERLFNEPDLVRRSTLCVYGERKTSAVCHCHDLRAFAPLGCSNVKPAFFATTQVASMKHSLRSMPPLSLRSVAST